VNFLGHRRAARLALKMPCPSGATTLDVAPHSRRIAMPAHRNRLFTSFRRRANPWRHSPGKQVHEGNQGHNSECPVEHRFPQSINEYARRMRKVQSINRRVTGSHDTERAEHARKQRNVDLLTCGKRTTTQRKKAPADWTGEHFRIETSPII
jgi:hypothetical protein